ncbi:hypothetical protein PybrP1_000615 [[Pythium] brassicae (nom. inval.)]|nr:hypothetical protein PybrP1_000615 [[Pythium] brassicae (nom. inval.)]
MAGKRKLGDSNSNGSSNAQKKRKPDGCATKAPAKPNVAASANANWLAMQAKLKTRVATGGSKAAPAERKHDLDVAAHKQRVRAAQQQQRREQRAAAWVDNARICAMDCEMVGVGLAGKTSALARCSIVDFDGAVLYDKFVRPAEKVTDFRTHVSGIRSRLLKTAIPFAQCLKEVGKLLKDKIIVGHALKNDFQALLFSPPKSTIRDTARYRPYMRRKKNGTKLYPKALKDLAGEVLGLEIQTGEHDSVEDARAALQLYKKEQFAWEKYLQSAKNPSALAGVAPALPREAAASKPSAELKKALDLDSDDEDGDDDGDDADGGDGAGDRVMRRAVKSGTLRIPDSKDLALMEYGE